MIFILSHGLLASRLSRVGGKTVLKLENSVQQPVLVGLLSPLIESMTDFVSEKGHLGDDFKFGEGKFNGKDTDASASAATSIIASEPSRKGEGSNAQDLLEEEREATRAAIHEPVDPLDEFPDGGFRAWLVILGVGHSYFLR